MKFDKYSYLILLLFVALIGLRVVHITADPPTDLSWSGGLFFDEGALAHNARNQVLFGQWKMDEWNDFYYSPVLAFVKWIIFAIFGVGMAQLRLVSLLFTAGTLGALYWACKVVQTRASAVLCMTLLGLNYVYLMYSRLGLTEISLLFWAVVTLYFWLLGFYAKTGWKRGFWMFWAGASCFMVYIFKALLIYFLPVPVTALIVFWLFPQKPSDRTRIAIMAGWLLLGMAVTAALWLLLFYLPNYEPIHQAGDYVKALSLPRSPQQFAKNAARAPFVDIFTQTPVHLLLSLAYFMYILYGLVHDRSKLSPLDLFAGLWFLAHLVFFLGYSYRPTRYYVPIIPAMTILAARAIGLLFGFSRKSAFFKRISVWFWAGCWLMSSGLIAVVLIPICYQLPFPTIPRLQTTLQVLVSAGFSLLCVVVIWLTIQRRGEHRFHYLAPLFKGGAGILIVGFLVSNGAQYYHWAKTPRHVIRDISRELGDRLDNAFIAGLETPMLSMENTHRALYVWENFTNYRDTFRTYPITHLFLAEFNDELAYYTRKFPKVMQQATLLKSYRIMGSRFHLFSIVEPAITDILVNRRQYQTREPVQVTLKLTNNDPRESKTLEPGIILVPKEPTLPNVRAKEEVQMEPLSRTEVSFSQPAAPGTYHLMAAFFPEQHDIYDVSELRAQGGDMVPDTETSGQQLRYAPSDFSGFLVYGPYRRYPAGVYDVEFTLKYHGISTAPNSPVATLDVSATAGQSVLIENALKTSDFVGAGAYQTFRLSFALMEPQTLEFRILAHGQVELWAGGVSVSFVPGVWHASPIVIQKTP